MTHQHTASVYDTALLQDHSSIPLLYSFALFLPVHRHFLIALDYLTVLPLPILPALYMAPQSVKGKAVRP